MLRPNSSVVKCLEAYDKKLSAKWNNKEKYFEIWYRMPWGNRLITPVVEGAFKIGGSSTKFVPLDKRIVEWLFKADGNRAHKNWKKLGRKKYEENEKLKAQKSYNKFLNMAKDNYNLVNRELINPMVETGNNWVKPDMQSMTRRLSVRTAENAKEYFNDANSSN